LFPKFLESIGKYRLKSLPKAISPKEHWMIYLNEASERRKEKNFCLRSDSDEFKFFP